MYQTPLMKCRDGVYRQVAARLLVAANDNCSPFTATAPACRQTYDLESALEAWRERQPQQRLQKEAA